jgi:H2-forming N5,N10-methylenetetrahydromethanopterin dehydrogenase-like enzyme
MTTIGNDLGDRPVYDELPIPLSPFRPASIPGTPQQSGTGARSATRLDAAVEPSVPYCE